MEDVQISIESEVVAGQDGNVRKLNAFGFVLIDEHGGTEGWKDIEGNRCFVDYFGGVWTKQILPHRQSSTARQTELN
jgi:hypothetical protein